MKLLCTGDWHAYNFTEFSKSLMVSWDIETMRYVNVTDKQEEYPDCKEMNSRLFNVLSGLCDMRNYCILNGISNVLLTGDVFHKRGTIEVVVFNAMYQVLSSYYDCSIEVHIIAGNHDQTDSSTIPISSIHSFQDIAHIVEKPEKFTIQDEDDVVEVVAVPYSKNKEFVLDSIESLRKECFDPDGAILICHLGITGGTVGSGMYSMKDEYSLGELKYERWKYLVAGHYHQPQLLAYNSIYPGTPVQNSFGDELKWNDGYNGFFVIDTSKRWDIQFIPIIAPRFITLTAEDIEDTSPEVFINNYVRVKSGAKDSEKVAEDLQAVLAENPIEDLNLRVEIEKDYNAEQRSEIGVSQSFEETVRIYAEERCEDGKSLDKYVTLGLDILAEATIGGK